MREDVDPHSEPMTDLASVKRVRQEREEIVQQAFRTFQGTEKQQNAILFAIWQTLEDLVERISQTPFTNGGTRGTEQG
jgi:triphosphoribosyl-dephospho-CoA synthetase